MILRPQSAYFVQQGPLGSVVHFTVNRLDASLIQSIGPELDRLAETTDAGQLQLDLQQVEYLTGGALGKLVALNRKVADAGGEFLVRNVNAFPFELFQITRLDGVMRVQPIEAKASSGASQQARLARLLSAC